MHVPPDLSLYHRIEPLRELSREHTFYLSLKAGVFERPISEPLILSLSVNPLELKFVVLSVLARFSRYESLLTYGE